LGTRAQANHYIQQFTEIFTEEGRKNVKIQHVVPGQAPRVTCTPGMQRVHQQHQQQQQQQQLQQHQQQQAPNVQRVHHQVKVVKWNFVINRNKLYYNDRLIFDCFSFFFFLFLIGPISCSTVTTSSVPTSCTSGL
jgi:hypothetical protein